MQNHQIPQATSPLSSWLYYLERLHSQAIELGLERVQRVAAHLDLLTPAPTVFTVAGTNGKGTTCRTLEAILLAAGLRVGVYSSPHLVRYTERVRIQGEELSEAEHSRSFAGIEAGRGETSLTYFEFGTPVGAAAVQTGAARRGDPGSGAGRASRRHQHRRSERGGDHQHRARSHRLAGQRSRKHRPREGRHFPQRQAGGGGRTRHAGQHSSGLPKRWARRCIAAAKPGASASRAIAGSGRAATRC